MSRQYKNAPIREAVCEFRFQADSPWDLAIPGLIYAQLREEFPKRLPSAMKSFGATLTVGPEGIQPRISQTEGLTPWPDEEFRFWRNDESGVIRVRPNLLSVSHYKPYPSWERLLPIIEKAFHAYKEVANPKGFHRIGLRYVNEMTFRENPVHLERYLNFYPFTGARIPQDYFSFMVGIAVAFNNERDILRLQLANSARDSSGQVPFVLDLDYFLGKPGGVSFEDVFEWLAEAHDHIEDTFEGCLTDRLRERFHEVGV